MPVYPIRLCRPIFQALEQCRSQPTNNRTETGPASASCLDLWSTNTSTEISLRPIYAIAILWYMCTVPSTYGVSKGHLSRDLPISVNHLPISVNEYIGKWITDIGNWFTDIGKWFTDIGKWTWFTDIGKSFTDIGNSSLFTDIGKCLAGPGYTTTRFQFI